MLPEFEVTVTEIKTFLQCRKKWWFEYVELLKPKVESTKLVRGKFIHKTIELINRTGYVNVKDIVSHETSNEIKIILNNVVKHYQVFLIEKNWKLLEIEKVFKVKIPGLYKTYLCGKIDAVVCSNKFNWIVEYKSKSSMSSGEMFELNLNKQLVLYSWAVENECKIPITGCLWVVIFVPDNRIAESGIQNWYNRHTTTSIIKVYEILYCKTDKENVLLDTKSIIRDMRTNKIYRNPTRDCEWYCAYKSLCIEDSIELRDVGFVKKSCKHEELL